MLRHKLGASRPVTHEGNRLRNEPFFGSARPIFFNQPPAHKSPAVFQAHGTTASEVITHTAYAFVRPETTTPRKQLAARFGSSAPLIAQLSTAHTDEAGYATPSHARIDNPKTLQQRALFNRAKAAFLQGLGGDRYAEHEIADFVGEDWGQAQYRVLHTVYSALPDEGFAAYLASWSLDDIYYFSGMGSAAVWRAVATLKWTDLRGVLRRQASARQLVHDLISAQPTVPDLLRQLCCLANCNWSNASLIESNGQLTRTMFALHAPETPLTAQLEAWSRATLARTSTERMAQSARVIHLLTGMRDYVSQHGTRQSHQLETAFRLPLGQMFGTSNAAVLPILEHLPYFEQRLNLDDPLSIADLSNVLDRTKGWRDIEDIRAERRGVDTHGERFVFVNWQELLARGRALGFSQTELRDKVWPHLDWGAEFAIAVDPRVSRFRVVARAHQRKTTYTFAFGNAPRPEGRAIAGRRHTRTIGQLISSQ